MKAPVLALLSTCLFAAAVPADTLLLDAIQTAPANTTDGLPRPSRGASMAAVETRFGAPAKTYDAVGEPPITRWTYPGYTVYFEYDRVIDVVLHR